MMNVVELKKVVTENEFYELLYRNYREAGGCKLIDDFLSDFVNGKFTVKWLPLEDFNED